MAIACLRLVTFLPLRPLLSVPFFISFISLSTFFPAEGEYFRVDFFFEEDFFAELFFVADFFFAAFFVAMLTLLTVQMAECAPTVALTAANLKYEEETSQVAIDLVLVA